MGTQLLKKEENNPTLNAYVKLIRAAESVSSRIYRGNHLDGLTSSQFGVLEALMHLGPLCQRELGIKILKSSGNITMVIDNLEKRDLVQRKRDRDDRRFVSVHLTKTGRKMIRNIFPRHVDFIIKEFKILSKTQQKELGKLCRLVGKGTIN